MASRALDQAAISRNIATLPRPDAYSVTVNRLQNVERGFLFDGADLGLDVGTETDLLHAVSIRFLIADLIHSETALSDHLLEGNTAFRVLAEVLARGGNGVTVFLR